MKKDKIPLEEEMKRFDYSVDFKEKIFSFFKIQLVLIFYISIGLFIHQAIIKYFHWNYAEHWNYVTILLIIIAIMVMLSSLITLYFIDVYIEIDIEEIFSLTANFVISVTIVFWVTLEYQSFFTKLLP